MAMSRNQISFCEDQIFYPAGAALFSPHALSQNVKERFVCLDNEVVESKQYVLFLFFQVKQTDHGARVVMESRLHICGFAFWCVKPRIWLLLLVMSLDPSEAC